MTRSSYLAFGRPDFSTEEIEAVARIMRSGWVGMGPETVTFEKELAAFMAVPEVVSLNSCTSALFLSLLAVGVGPGDEVITPSLTWCATANAALYLGATPVFCDIDEETLCVGLDSVLKAVTPRTKAVVPVHYGGFAFDVRTLRALLPAHVAIVEDAAHALGGRYSDGTPVGSSGNLTCFSFYANKNLSTGEGGAIAVAAPATAERLRSLRQNGMPSNAWMRFTDPKIRGAGHIVELGYKANYIDLLAAIGRVQLKRQPEFAQRRLDIAREYARKLPSLPAQRGLLDDAHARHLYVVKLPSGPGSVPREDVLREMRARNFGAAVHYTPLHSMPFYHQQRPSLPVTDKVADAILTLPISASMSVADASDAADALRESARL
ncbi:MAG: DegT/DnrJ/EryC1/StrS family aminotransferase [Vicinamibacteria bacterium]